MKKNHIFALLLILSFNCLFSQSGWFWQNPLPQGNFLNNVSFVNSSVVYVSGYGGTLMKSTDGGSSYEMLETGLNDNLSVDFINELTGFSASSNGILRTTNGGTFWEYFQIHPDIPTIKILYNGSSTLFALVKKDVGNSQTSSIYKSTDLGQNWVLCLSPTINTYVNSLHFSDGQTGYAVGYKHSLFQYGKVYKTTNAGATWDSVASTLRYAFNNVHFFNGNTGFVTTFNNRNNILKTTNGCLSWDTIFTLSNQMYSFVFFDNNNGYLNSGSTIVKTTNGGMNWSSSQSGKFTFLQNMNDGLGLGYSGMGGSSNFIYKTSNSGINWSSVTQGFVDYFFDVVFINEYTGFTGGYNKIYKTTNGGYNWDVYSLGSPEYPFVENLLFVDQSTGYAGLSYGLIGKTTNCGINWNIYETDSYDHNHGLSFPSVDTGYSVTKYGFFLKTVNGGVNWTTLMHASGQDFGDITFINNNTGFAGGRFNDNGIIRKTTNGGFNWDSFELDSIVAIADVTTSDDLTWFAAGYDDYASSAYAGMIYRSTDAGISWEYTRFPNSLSSITFPTALVGYASSQRGIMYKTTDRGDNWFPTDCINFNASDGLFFVNENTGYGVSLYGQIIKTTTGGGSLIGISPVSLQIPHNFSLSQNYPNPFNPVTKIQFQIPANVLNGGNRFVKIIIYDLLGREVTTLVNEQLNPGSYSVDWDGSMFASGVYFYSLVTGDYVETKRMVLLK